jgi:predicted Zn-dependent protease
MKRRIFLSPAVAASLSLLCGCAAIELTVAPSKFTFLEMAVKAAPKVAHASRPVNDVEEHYIGRAVAALILSRYPLYKDPRLTLYLNQVGQTVLRKTSRPSTYGGYHFAILDSDEPNAFASPGGIVLVTLGLLRLCENEDELAAVLAHEVAHVARRDGINAISEARWAEVLSFIGMESLRRSSLVARELLGHFESSIDDVFKTIVVNGYSYTAEEAADEEAVATLEKAGYNPRALAVLLSKMVSQTTPEAGIIKTHPPTTDRLARVRTVRAEPLSWRPEGVRTARFNEAAHAIRPNAPGHPGRS